MIARPAGAYVIKDGRVWWRPAVDVNRLVATVGAVAIAYLFTRVRIEKARAAIERMTQASTSERGWLLITVSTAGAPPALRVQVWRRLRALGALYLQQSVCLLPDPPEVTRAVRRLLDRVHRDGGEGRLLKVVLTDPAEDHAIIEEFRRERAVEYADLLERIPEFLAELDRERARGRTTYAEVEESEADLHRFQSWLAKIAARDYFDAPGAAEARAAVERCAAALAAFEEAALAAEAPEPTPTPVPGQRHLHLADANDLDA